MRYKRARRILKAIAGADCELTIHLHPEIYELASKHGLDMSRYSKEPLPEYKR